MGKQKRKVESLQSCSTKRVNNSKGEEEELGNSEFDHCGIPLPLCHQAAKSHVTCVGKTLLKKRSGAVFVLENASLKKAVVRKKRKILCAEEDRDYLLRHGKNPNDYRPDIFYEALRSILDSPLNQAGFVGGVFVKTDSGLPFEVKPRTRIPRTLKRFCGIMLELQEKSCVRAKDTGEVLIQVLKEPLMHYIPENARAIGLSYGSQKVVDIEDYVSAASDDLNLVFAVGALGSMVESVRMTRMIIYLVSLGRFTRLRGLCGHESFVSHYRLSANCCVGLICEALEQKWNLYPFFPKELAK